MPDVTPVIKTIIAGIMASRRPLISPASKTELALLVFIALCAMVDVFLLALALYQYLTGSFAPFVAALICAAAFFAAALLAAMLIKFIAAQQAAAHKPVEEELRDNIHLLVTSLLNEIEEPIRESPKLSVAMAALAGLVAARRI